jgi:DNA-binding response OmpR family regulator
MASQKSILFVEDERELLDTFGTLLRDQGYAVMIAESAEVAMQLISRSTPDLIIADIKLPGIDGFDLYRTIRTMDELKGVPFVFLTAFNDLRAAAYARTLGAAEYITKPFDFEYLIARIKMLVPL